MTQNCIQTDKNDFETVKKIRKSERQEKRRKNGQKWATKWCKYDPNVKTGQNDSKMLHKMAMKQTR